VVPISERTSFGIKFLDNCIRSPIAAAQHDRRIFLLKSSQARLTAPGHQVLFGTFGLSMDELPLPEVQPESPTMIRWLISIFH
jgi:hypothetical protein